MTGKVYLNNLEHDLTVHNALSTALWRFHNEAMERALIIYTYSRSSFEHAPELDTAYGRQLAFIIDNVHEFCFQARKAIERAEVYIPGLIASLKTQTLHNGEQTRQLTPMDYPTAIALTQESFWWVINRIMHSKESGVVWETKDVVITNHTTGAHYLVQQPVAFSFASDKDIGKTVHFAELEALSRIYVSLVGRRVEHAIALRSGLPTITV